MPASVQTIGEYCGKRSDAVCEKKKKRKVRKEGRKEGRKDEEVIYTLDTIGTSLFRDNDFMPFCSDVVSSYRFRALRTRYNFLANTIFHTFRHIERRSNILYRPICLRQDPTKKAKCSTEDVKKKNLRNH